MSEPISVPVLFVSEPILLPGMVERNNGKALDAMVDRAAELIWQAALPPLFQGWKNSRAADLDRVEIAACAELAGLKMSDLEMRAIAEIPEPKSWAKAG